ncbi:Ig-like domain-containing protein, partial [Pseudomonas sp. D1HM]
MKNIVIVDKSTGAGAEHAFGNVALNETSIVKLPISPASVQSMQQSGKNLVVTLKSGETVTIQNFFAVGEDGATSQLVLEDEDGTLYLGQYSSPYSGFTFSEISSLEELTLAAQAGTGTPDWLVWGLSLLGVGAAIAILSRDGGGGGGGGDGGDTTAPTAPTDLSVSPDGATVFGKGEAGTTVTIKDAQGNTVGTGTVGSDGNFAVGLKPPQVNGETLDVTLTDGSGNVSDPSQVV